MTGTRHRTRNRRDRRGTGRCIAPKCGRRCRGNLCSARCSRNAARDL